MKRKRKLFDKKDISNLVLILATFLVTSYFGKHLTGFPTGIDTYAHLTRVEFILKNFPHINWNPFWDSGGPFWLFSHPPFTAVFQALLVWVTHLSTEMILTWFAATSFYLLLVGIYIFTKSYWGKWTGLFAVLLVLGNPGSFGWWSDGNYTRVFASGFWFMALGLANYYIRNYRVSKNRLIEISIIIFSVLAHGSHLLLGALTVVSILFVILISKVRQKEALIGRIVGLPILISAYWYLPLLVIGNPGHRFLGGSNVAPVEWRNFIYPLHLAEHFSLMPLITIILLISLAVFIVSKNKITKGILSVSLFTLVFFLYVTIGHLPGYPRSLYINGMPPISAFPLFAWFIAIFTSGIVHKINNNKTLELVLLLLAVIAIGFNIPKLVLARRDMTAWNVRQSWYQDMIKINPDDKNYRFGTDSAFVADWFNYKFQLPQTRDYFNQGQLYPDWISYLENAVWYQNGNLLETNSLLHWYGVNYFFVGDPHYNVDKFYNKSDYLEVAEQFPNNPGPDSYALGKPADEIFEFKFKDKSPILYSTNAPVILVLSDKSSYDVLFRDLTRVGLDDRYLIPINAGTSLKYYTISDLKQFSGIFVYGEKLDAKSEELIGEYVKEGGKLVYDTGGVNDFNVNYDFLPSVTFSDEIYKGDWNAKWQGNGNVDLSKFSPLIYSTSGWRIFQVDKSNLKPGSQQLLSRNGWVWVTKQSYGDGAVVWSGLNLPYHILNSNNDYESTFFKNFVVDFWGLKVNLNRNTGKFINTEKRSIDVDNQGRGILLKESFWADWHAYVNNKEVKIYRAGPDFMYVFSNNKDGQVNFIYKLSLVEWLSWFLSLSGVVIAGYLYLKTQIK